MKKLILISLLVGLMSVSALAVPSLGGWAEGAPRSVHVLWTFDSTPGPDGPFYDYTAFPAVYTSEGNQGAGTATSFINVYTGSYVTGGFSDPARIDVMLEISNFTGGAAKTIWIDVDYVGSLTGMTALGNVAGGGSLGTLLTPPIGSNADFGFSIVPNPDKEDIWFSILAPAGLNAELLELHVDTICSIPAPGAILLGSIGVGLVGWLRRRRAL